MKQKITLEIQNSTGLEFEERGEWRRPKIGEYYVGEYGSTIRQMTDSLCDEYFVLTPKIDHELEQAKKRFIFDYFLRRNNSDLKRFRSIYRGSSGDIFITSENGLDYALEDCTPFPIPTWRCCESDKPKKDGLYLSRHKIEKYKHTCRFLNGAFTCRADSNYEWLDEGEL